MAPFTAESAMPAGDAQSRAEQLATLDVICHEMITDPTVGELLDAASKDIPGLPAAIGPGEFKPLVDWLSENVRGKASYLSTRDLLTAATGRPLDPAMFKAHLKARYLP